MAASAAAAVVPKGRMVVFGASGFIGGRICKEAVKQGYAVVGLSRTGRELPYVVGGSNAPGSFVMKTADAADTTTYEDHLKGASVVVVTIGAPPVPNFLYKGGKQEAIASNGTACIRPIAAASAASVPRVVLVNACMPSWLKHISSGYYIGKTMSESAIKKYATGTPTSAAILKPSAVFGTRHVGSMHFPIPLSLVFSPVRVLMRIPAGKAQFCFFLKAGLLFFWENRCECMYNLDDHRYVIVSLLWLHLRCLVYKFVCLACSAELMFNYYIYCKWRMVWNGWGRTSRACLQTS